MEERESRERAVNLEDQVLEVRLEPRAQLDDLENLEDPENLEDQAYQGDLAKLEPKVHEADQEPKAHKADLADQEKMEELEHREREADRERRVHEDGLADQERKAHGENQEQVALKAQAALMEDSLRAKLVQVAVYQNILQDPRFLPVADQEDRYPENL